MDFKANLTMTNVNLSAEKQGKSDERRTAIDLHFSGTVTAEDMGRLFVDRTGYADLIDSLYDDDGDLHALGIRQVATKQEFQDVTLRLETGFGTSIEFDEVKLNGIGFKPEAGKVVELKLRAQLHPTGKEIATLADWQEQDLQVLAVTRQSSLLDDDGDDDTPQDELH